MTQAPADVAEPAVKSTRTSPSNIEIIVFGFLVSLTLKGTLDTAFGPASGRPVSGLTTWPSLWDAVCSPHSCQVLIMLLTLIRFIYGAYRVSEGSRRADLEVWVLPWIVPTLLVLFVLFYITALCVLNPLPFYSCLVVVHVWDFLTFLVPLLFSDKLERRLKHAMRTFVIIDAITVMALGCVVWKFPQQAVLLGALTMVACAALDFFWNRRFYFSAEASSKP